MLVTWICAEKTNLCEGVLAVEGSKGNQQYIVNMVVSFKQIGMLVKLFWLFSPIILSWSMLGAMI
jgi:hypothetical protein